MRRKVSGIYAITVARDEKDNRFYIGQSSDVAARLGCHFSRLRAGIHKNPPLQNAFYAYGKSAFSAALVLISESNKEVLSLYEQAVLDFYILKYGIDAVYNCHKECTNSRLGVVVSDETRAKQSASLRGRKLSEEQKRAMSLRMVGRKLSPEAVAKRTIKQTGRVTSPETRARQSLAQKGRSHSPETRAKISAAKAGTPISAEHRERLRLLAVGRPMPQKVRDALRAALVGKKKSPEELARRQATRRANAEAKRQI